MDDDRAAIDRRLAERIDAGDVSALGAIYDAYAGAVYRHALSLLRSPADAEDVLQEVFLKLVSRRGGPIRDLKAYLLTAARHQAILVIRRRAREVETDTAAGHVSAAASPDAAIDAEAVRGALERLSAAQREVVVLKVYEQMTFAEIGRRLRASVNTVASRYRYGLEKLRQVLGE
jgi:RNA polymerase sigma-70 factor (ECF subfamily)